MRVVRCNPHSYYLDRTVKINGESYNVWRCKHCGHEYKVKV